MAGTYASLVDPPPNPDADTLGSRPTHGRFEASRFAASASRNRDPTRFSGRVPSPYLRFCSLLARPSTPT